MQTLNRMSGPNLLRSGFIRKRDLIVERLRPRRCMVGSVALILAGMVLAGLMACKLLPVTLLLGFAGIGLVAAGGALVLFYCGAL